MALALACAPTSTPTTDPPADNQPAPQDGDQAPAIPQSSIAGQLAVQSDAEAPAAAKGTRALALRSTAAEAVVSAGPGQDAVPGELLVTFDPAMTPDDRRAVLADAGLELIECSPSGACRAAAALSADVGKDARRLRQAAADAADCLRGHPVVTTVEANPRRTIALAPGDPFFSYQWHFAAVRLPEAWDITTGSEDVMVAVVDTGVLYGHPDLQGRFVGGYDFIADPASARDGDGRDDDPTDAGDLFGGPGQSSFHGTHVAGLIAAAADNGVGVAGAGWRTRVMPLRALGVDGGTAFDVAEAIRYAAGLPNVSGTLPARRADVINLSLVGVAGQSASAVELAAIGEAAAAGVLLVAAAGNNGSSLPAYPAAAPEVISVSAIEIQLEPASYSNYGSTIDLAAPGGFLGTDVNGDGFGDGVLSTGGSDVTGRVVYEYVFANGTSMAAPHVSAIAALVLAAHPALSAGEVREILETTAADLGPAGRDDRFGHGLVDAAAAVAEAARRAGHNPVAPSRLFVSNDTLNFGTDLALLRVQVADKSGGSLTIESVAVRTLDGDGWLDARADPIPTGASAGTVTVRVDRAGLPNGGYRGVATIAAAGFEPASVEVIMAVGAAGDPDEIIYVLAVDPQTRDSVGEGATNASRSYVYVIEKLPAGSYVLYAGTDRDDDGYICEVGDLCGALPSRLEPEVITLGEAERHSGADFSVARLVLQQALGGAPGAASLRRATPP